MKKVVFAALLLFLIAIPVSAQATQRSTASIPSITFSGTTATCTVSVNGDSANDSISLTAKLYQGNKCIATWTDSGNGKLRFSRTKNRSKRQNLQTDSGCHNQRNSTGYGIHNRNLSINAHFSLQDKYIGGVSDAAVIISKLRRLSTNCFGGTL